MAADAAGNVPVGSPLAMCIGDCQRTITGMIDKGKEFAQGAPQWIDQAQQLVQSQIPNQESLQNTVTSIRGQLEDITPVGATADLFKNLLGHYTWVAVCLFAGSVNGALLGKLIGPLFGMVIGSGALFCFTVIVEPYLIIDVLPTKVEGSEDDKRLYQLLLVALNGLLFAAFVSGSWVSFMAPPVFLAPLLVGVLANVLGASVAEQPRYVMFAALIGPCLALFFVYGFITASFTGLYLLWTLLYALIAAADLQVKIALFKSGRQIELYHQGVSIALFTTVCQLMTLLASVKE